MQVKGRKVTYKGGAQLLIKKYRKAAERQLPYGITQCSCHLTQINAPRLNPSQTGRYSIYLPRGMEN